MESLVCYLEVVCAQLKSWKSREIVNKPKRIFCFLPLPIHTELPVHINGHFALSHESRQGLWFDTNNSYMVQWNKFLINNIIAPAYCTLICAMRDRIMNLTSIDAQKRQMIQYFNLFPKVNVTGMVVPYVKNMSKAVYKYIATNNKEVLPLQSEPIMWVSIKGADLDKIFFDNLNDQIQDESTKSLHTFHSEIVRQVLVRSGFRLYDCPIWLCKQFEDSGVAVDIVSPSAVLEFFATSKQINDEYKLPRSIENTSFKNMGSLLALLKYCTKANNYKAKLEGLPFLMTVDNVVRSFDSSSLKYVSLYSDLMPQARDMFISKEITDVLKLDVDMDYKLCKKFTLPEFARLIPELLPQGKFCGSEQKVSLSDLLKSLPSEIGITWLKRVWEFISTFIPSHKRNIHELICPIENWCFLPVLCDGTGTLYPLSKASSVIHLLGPKSLHQHIVDILTKLDPVQPIYRLFGNCSDDLEVLLKSVLGNIEQPDTVLLALKDLMQLHSVVGKLNLKECLDLLSYFSQSINNRVSIKEAFVILKSLPFYETVSGKVIKLDYERIFILKSKIPNGGIDNLCSNQRIILLNNNHGISDLLSFLKCEHLSIPNVYCNFIFKKFNIFLLEDQIAHMEFIKDHVKKLPDTNPEVIKLLNCLKTLAFIPEKNGSKLFVASELFDPDNNVFKVMLSEENFPQHPYKDQSWLTFLRKIGLISEVTQQHFVKFSSDVAKIALEDKTIAVEKSHVLLKHFYQRNDLDDNFLSLVKNIAFVKPKNVGEDLSDLHQQYGNRDTQNTLQFIAFNRAAIESQEKYVWTVQSILSSSPSGLPSSVFAAMLKMGVSLEAQPEMVAKHLKKLCTHVCSKSLVGQEMEFCERRSLNSL